MQPLRMLVATTMSLLILAAFTSTATAGRLSLSSQAFTAGFSRLDFTGGFGTWSCPLTLSGSLHSRTIAKVRGQLIGYLTDARYGRCITGSATILSETLPWHIRYVGFTGRLPILSQLITNVSGWAFRIQEPIFGITCLASGGVPFGTYNVEANGRLTSAVISGSTPTNCGIEGTLSGTSNSITAVTVTLI